MNARADAHQVRRWQEEIARDPGHPAFLPLAEVYRREGRLDVARRLCLRGLERNPEHVDAHFLLGRIHREQGELERAFDEWDIALRLDPEHRAARRALGYLCLERRDWPAAVRHLELAAAAAPADSRVASALALARRHAAAAPRPAGPPRELADALAGPLGHFERESRVRLVLVLDPDGRVVARHGSAAALDVAAFASLSASVNAASRALAEQLGQPAFDQLYQGEGEHQLFLARFASPAGELILVTVFGAETTIGLVRVLFQTFAARAFEIDWTPPLRQARPSAAAFEAHLAAGLERAPGGSAPPRLFR